MRRAATLFLLTQRFKLGGHFIYFEHIRKVYRKISRRLSKHFISKHEEEMNLKIGLEYSDKTSCFEPKCSSKVSKKFSRGAMKTNKY